MVKNEVQGKTNPSIKVSNNGPYLVSGRLPLQEKIIQYDTKLDVSQWKDDYTYPLQDQYRLCRCGHSQNKPFCDGTHATAKFDGTETASHTVYQDEAVTLNGPGLRLYDAKILCASARFCHRGGGIWRLIKSSDKSRDKSMAIDEAAECPSGRLVVFDYSTKESLEPLLEPSIVLINDPYIHTYGPLWVRGNILIAASDGQRYEIRNRVTLCRCGKSKNKPFCDSSHWPEEGK